MICCEENRRAVQAEKRMLHGDAEQLYAVRSSAGAQPRPISGRPDPRHISTSYTERNNLNCRTFLRRLTRLTNTFSKRVENLIAALWLYFAHYNFLRIRGSLRITPAMATGATDHVWTIEELLNAGTSI